MERGGGRHSYDVFIETQVKGQHIFNGSSIWCYELIDNNNNRMNFTHIKCHKTRKCFLSDFMGYE